MKIHSSLQIKKKLIFEEETQRFIDTLPQDTLERLAGLIKSEVRPETCVKSIFDEIQPFCQMHRPKMIP
jgi:hypothetical protein